MASPDDGWVSTELAGGSVGDPRARDKPEYPNGNVADARAPGNSEWWADEKAGRVVRPYALVRGRTRPAGADFDVVAIVTVARRITPDPAVLEPEHLELLCLCPATVADLAESLRLPLAVIRIILSDLRERGFVHLHRPVQPTRLTDTALLRRVADGLRRL